MLMAKTIFNNLMHKYATRLHPVQQRVLPEGFRGRFKFAIDKCIMCRACVLKCPTKCIRIEPDTGLWEREVMACIYCGVCADVCPTGCITMTNVYRPPITEPAYLRFQCKPKPVKKPKGKGGAESALAKDDIEEAIKEKQKEREEG